MLGRSGSQESKRSCIYFALDTSSVQCNAISSGIFNTDQVYILLKRYMAFVTMIFRSVPDLKLKRYLNVHLIRAKSSEYLKFEQTILFMKSNQYCIQL